MSAGGTYIVGEKHPELFVPDVDGTIYPSVPPGFGGAASVGVAAASPAPAVNHYHQTVQVHVNARWSARTTSWTASTRACSRSGSATGTWGWRE